MDEVLVSHIMGLSDKMIFVYGANLAGIHGKGAALTAKTQYGAVQGKYGLAGNSYGIPTKNRQLKTLPLDLISIHVADFFYVANQSIYNKNYFLVTPIGCGLAGYRPEGIAPIFFDLAVRYKFPRNIILPKVFIDEIPPTETNLIKTFKDIKSEFLYNVVGTAL